MKKGQASTLVFLTVVLFVIGVIVNYAPIYWKGKSLVKYLSDITGLPEDELYLPRFLWMFILPIMGSTAMVLAIINMATGWFVTDKNLNLIIALSWIGVMMATPLRASIWAIFVGLGFYSIIIWATLFVIGSYIITIKFYKTPEKYLGIITAKDVGKLTAKYNKLLKDWEDAMNARDYTKAAEIRRKMEDVHAQIKFIEAEQRKIATGSTS